MCCRASAYDDESVRRTVLWYFMQGGRHIDTAALYLNHKAIGVAIQQAIARGIPRSEMFIVTKLNDRRYAGGKAVIDPLLIEFAKELQVDYIDLILLHSPKAFVPIGHGGNNDWYKNRITAWKALAAAKERGIVRNIGVSNFDINHLTEINALPETKNAPISVNQFMLSPFSPSFAFKIAKYCQENNIAVVAHSSLSGIQKNAALNHATINQIKDSNNNLKTSSQVLLKWALQMGFVVIPGSGNPKHQISNLNIYSTSLTEKEMKIIQSLRDDDSMFYMDTRGVKAKEEM